MSSDARQALLVALSATVFGGDMVVASRATLVHMSSDERRSQLAQAGRWLREQRQDRGYATAAEFARALGVDKAVVSNYETGRSAVPDERAERIAATLKMDIIEVRRGLRLWVPSEVGGVRPGSTEEEVLASSLDPATKEALLSIRGNLARWAARRDAARIRRAKKIMEIVEDDQDTA